MSVEFLLTATQLHEKSHLKRLTMNDLEGHSRSSKLPLYDRPYIAIGSVVTTFLSCTISEILPLLQCTWCTVTLRSPSLST